MLVVTPVMHRVHQVPAAAEQIFCDSRSSCDASHSTVTILLAAIKAGAFPIAVLIHDNQSTDSYITAFKLLKNSHPACFGNSEVSFVLS